MKSRQGTITVIAYKPSAVQCSLGHLDACQNSELEVTHYLEWIEKEKLVEYLVETIALDVKLKKTDQWRSRHSRTSLATRLPRWRFWPPKPSRRNELSNTANAPNSRVYSPDTASQHDRALGSGRHCARHLGVLVDRVVARRHDSVTIENLSVDTLWHANCSSLSRLLTAPGSTHTARAPVGKHGTKA